MSENLYQPVPTTKTNTLSIISLITGILGLLAPCMFFIPVVGWICGAGGFIFSIAGLVTGLIGLSQIKKGNDTEKGRGMALAGVVMGAIGILLLCLIGLLLILSVLGIFTLPFLDPSLYGGY